MKEIAERFPKAWELFIDWFDEHHPDLAHNSELSPQLIWLFGIFVLEFFPKHGIIIGIAADIGTTADSWFFISITGYPIGQQGFKTPQEAIEKAFEIIEKQLDRK